MAVKKGSPLSSPPSYKPDPIDLMFQVDAPAIMESNINIRVPSELRDEFNKACKAQGLTGSRVIRVLMEEYVKRKKV